MFEVAIFFIAVLNVCSAVCNVVTKFSIRKLYSQLLQQREEIELIQKEVKTWTS